MHTWSFREVVIKFLTSDGKDGSTPKQMGVDSFCKACKAAKKDIDCANCSRDFKVLGGGKA